MKLTIHAALWLGVCSIACTLTSARMGAQTFTTTTVQGTVYLANGRPGSGMLQLSWPAFTTAGNQAVTAGRTNVTIGADGYVSVNLAPNLGSTPAGLYYTAVYHLSDGTTSTEYWVVPAAAQANLSQVRAQVMPAAQAVQAVSKGYVDQSISELTQSLLTASGGSLSGPLFLNGDPAQPTQAATKRYVDSEFSQALPLSGGVVSGPLTSVQLGAAYQVDQFPGADFGAKLQACVNALNGTYGGTCDARNFTGTLAMGAAVTVTTANATVQLPCATIATANQIRITAGTRNVTLHGCALRGASDASGSQGGTVFLYSGADPMIQVGDPTYTTNTVGFHLDNVVINTTASTNPTAAGFTAFRAQELNLESLYLLGNSNQTGMTLDGTGNYTGGTFQDIEFGGFGTALSAVGHQVSNSATTDWVNASAFLRLHINCPTSGGSPTPGTYGIDLVQGDGNTFTGGDVEGCATALHLGQNAQNNTIVGLRNENSINQVVADAGSSYNNWMTGGTMFTGQLTDNGTRNSFLDTFHRSFNGLNGDWYGSQKDATVTNHYRIGTGTGNERGLLDRYQTDWGYRWTTGLSDATAGAQFYQVLDELNNVYRLSVGQHNPGQPSTNDQTVVNAAGTGAVVLNGSANSGTGGVIFGAGGASGAAVATINSAGNAQFNGSLQVGGPSTFTNSTTVKNQSDAEIDSVLWAGSTANQKESVIYKDYTGASQWYMVKDATNNWSLNSALGGLDSFKAYQSNNSGDTYVNASNPAGHIRLNYETGAGAETDIYSGTSSSLVAAFLGTSAIKFPGLSSSTGRNCLQIDNSGYISNTGTACGAGSGGTVNAGSAGQVAYYASNGTVIAGTNSVGITSGGTGASSAQQALQNLGAQSALPGVSSDGSSGVTVSGGVRAGSAVAQSIGGLRYGSQFQNGGGNNGIANAAAANQTVVADPGYALTEQYSPTSIIPNWPNAFQFQDARGGKSGSVFHNWGNTSNLYGDSSNPASLFYAQMDGAPNAGGQTANQTTTSITLNSTTPGFSLSFPGFGGQGWQVSKGINLNQFVNGSGIAESMNCALSKYGVGDAVCGYFTLNGSGGWTAPNDEQEKALSVNTYEDTAVYTGTCSTGCTTGSTQVKTIPVNAAGHQGTGRYVIDTAPAPTACHVTNIIPGLDATHMSAVTVDCTVPVSTAWGTLASNVSTPNNTVPPFTTSETFNVNIQNGTFTTGLACFASMYHDQATITAAGIPSGGVQSVTVAAHKQHASGSEIFQGGMCGNGMEVTSYTQAIAGTTYRYLFDVAGSTDVHTLQVLEWFTGAAQPLTKFGNNFNVNNALYGCFNASTLSNSGTTTVTATLGSFCSTNFGTPSQFNGATLYINNASDPAFNGNCTNSTWSDSSHFTCTESVLAGSHTAASATVQLSNSGSVLGINNVNLWPMAAVLDVQDETTTPPSVNGAFTLEPNNIAFASGDTIEEPHHLSAEFQGAVINDVPINPINFGNALSVGLGNNAQGGATSVASNAGINLSNNGTPDTKYMGLGGWWIPPNAMNIAGAYYIHFNIDHGPSPNQYVLNIKPTTAQKADVNYCFNLFGITHSTGSATWLDCPNSGNDTLATGGNFTLNVIGATTYTASSHVFNGGATFNGNVNLNGAVNTINNATLSTVGGMSSSQGYNYAPNSNTLSASTWQTAAGSGTVTCGITDDLGDPACVLTATASSFAWHDKNTAGYTALTLNAQYVEQVRLKGSVGGELITLGGDAQGSNIHTTTSWANYCVPFTASSNGNLSDFAGINLNANGAVIYAANVVIAPGNSCSPGPLPLTTVNNQYTSLASINHASTFDANSYTMAGAAVGSGGGLAGPLNGSGTLPISQLGTGTPAAGKYVDGGTGAWTALPPNNAFNTSVPPSLQFLGDGSEGAYTCTTGTCNLAVGEHWYSSFSVSAGASVSMNGNPSQMGLVIRSTGTCTVAGTLSADAYVGGNATLGGGGGGGGGGTAIGTAGGSSYGSQGGGMAGTAGGGAGGAGGTSAAAPVQKAFLGHVMPQMSTAAGGNVLNSLGGAAGGAGGSSGPAGGKGGGFLTLDCQTVNLTGTITASGANGGASTGNNIGASGGGGGGIVILRSPNLTNSGTIAVTGGTGGSCGAFTGCGAGGNGAAGWSMVFSQ